MKKICIISKYENGVVDAIKKLITNVEITVIKPQDMESLLSSTVFDLVVLVEFFEDIPENLLLKNNFINIHPSLLPAFPKETAIQDAYISGVKVTGVTVYKQEPHNKRILAQYPILIDNYTNYNQLIEEIETLEIKLYPLVIKSILDDKLFDIVDMLNNSSHHQCGGCGGCKRCES